MVRTATRTFGGDDAAISRLLSVGIRFGDGNRLHFDEERFRDAFEAGPEAVVEFFAREETGFAATLDDMIDEMTRTFDGVIARKNESLVDQQTLINNRIEAMNLIIEAKRARLQAQFNALESALANLQGQQNALGVLAQLASQGA
jgi:flagellar hook-associated protein 2